MRKARSLAGESTLRVLCCLFAAAFTAAARGADEDGGPRITARALFEDRALLEIDGRRRVLEAGQRSPEGVLLVDADPRAAQIEVDCKAYTIALDASIGTTFSRDIQPKRLSLAPASDGHYYVDGTINGTGVRFVVDTGASGVAISRHDAKRIGLLYRVDGEPMPVETASGVAAAYRVVFRSVKARAIEVTNVPGIVIDGDYPTVALLGQSFLNRLDMRREGRLLELKER
ncbi:MAG: TIGR02281 family clan AA aspartic protease [Gammaproteobacteria bacterium]